MMQSGAVRSGYVTMVRSVEHGLFWWTFQYAGSAVLNDRLELCKDRTVFYTSATEILGVVVASPPPSLWLRRSGLRVSSMEQGRQIALESLVQHARQIEDYAVEWMREISLHDEFPRDFFFDPRRWNPQIEMTIGESLISYGKRVRSAKCWQSFSGLIQARRNLAGENLPRRATGRAWWGASRRDRWRLACASGRG